MRSIALAAVALAVAVPASGLDLHTTLDEAFLALDESTTIER